MQTRSMTRETIATNPQAECPLFNGIPGEVRDRIFQHAVTEYTPRETEYEKDEHYYRPHFRFADNYIDTALLRTCRRIYQETRHLPRINYQHIEWRYRAPPTQHGRANLSLMDKRLNTEEMRSMHMFAQQFALEGWVHGDSMKISKKAPNLQHLKLTLRHGDWWNWESQQLLRLDPKQDGSADPNQLRKEGDPFHPHSWGSGLRHFNLKEFELELETVEGKRSELDDIVRRAPSWVFPTAGNRVLVLNHTKTKKTGWIGRRFRKCSAQLNSSLAVARLFTCTQRTLLLTGQIFQRAELMCQMTPPKPKSD